MSRTATDLAILALAFAVGSLVAAAAGATNAGTALTFGQLAFAGTLIWMMLRR